MLPRFCKVFKHSKFLNPLLFPPLTHAEPNPSPFLFIADGSPSPLNQIMTYSDPNYSNAHPHFQSPAGSGFGPRLGFRGSECGEHRGGDGGGRSLRVLHPKSPKTRRAKMFSRERAEPAQPCRLCTGRARLTRARVSDF